MNAGRGCVTTPCHPAHATPSIPRMANYADSACTPRTLTEREQRALLKVTGEHRAGFRDHVLYAMALGTGLREHELIALSVGRSPYRGYGGRRETGSGAFETFGAGGREPHDPVANDPMTKLPRKKMLKPRTTAAELMAQLNADPEFVAALAREDDELRRLEQEHAVAEAPLVGALRAAGFAVESAWDFVQAAEPYPDAVPILLEHLQRPYPDRVREGIARALAVPEARPAWPLLVRLYRDETLPDTKSGLAVALSAIADDAVLDELITLIRDGRHGETRILLLGALERSKDRRARAALMALGTDPELVLEIQDILRRLERRRKRRRKP